MAENRSVRLMQFTTQALTREQTSEINYTDFFLKNVNDLSREYGASEELLQIMKKKDELKLFFQSYFKFFKVADHLDFLDELIKQNNGFEEKLKSKSTTVELDHKIKFTPEQIKLLQDDDQYDLSTLEQVKLALDKLLKECEKLPSQDAKHINEKVHGFFNAELNSFSHHYESHDNELEKFETKLSASVEDNSNLDLERKNLLQSLKKEKEDLRKKIAPFVQKTPQNIPMQLTFDLNLILSDDLTVTTEYKTIEGILHNLVKHYAGELNHHKEEEKNSKKEMLALVPHLKEKEEEICKYIEKNPISLEEKNKTTQLIQSQYWTYIRQKSNRWDALNKFIQERLYTDWNEAPKKINGLSAKEAAGLAKKRELNAQDRLGIRGVRRGLLTMQQAAHDALEKSYQTLYKEINSILAKINGHQRIVRDAKGEETTVQIEGYKQLLERARFILKKTAFQSGKKYFEDKKNLTDWTLQLKKYNSLIDTLEKIDVAKKIEENKKRAEEEKKRLSPVSPVASSSPSPEPEPSSDSEFARNAQAAASQLDMKHLQAPLLPKTESTQQNSEVNHWRSLRNRLGIVGTIFAGGVAIGFAILTFPVSAIVAGVCGLGALITWAGSRVCHNRYKKAKANAPLIDDGTGQPPSAPTPSSVSTIANLTGSHPSTFVPDRRKKTRPREINRRPSAPTRSRTNSIESVDSFVVGSVTMPEDRRDDLRTGNNPRR